MLLVPTVKVIQIRLVVDYEICKTIDVAVKSAFRDAKKGDTILLAPAAASFDQFSSFEERGQAFELEVNKLM